MLGLIFHLRLVRGLVVSGVNANYIDSRILETGITNSIEQ